MQDGADEPLDHAERANVRYIVERLDEALRLAENVPARDLQFLLAKARRAAEEALEPGHNPDGPGRGGS